METVLTYNDLLSKVTALEKLLRSKDEDIKHRDEVITCKDEDIKRKDEEIKRKEERIAYLERLLFGSRRDKLASQWLTLRANAARDMPGSSLMQRPTPTACTSIISKAHEREPSPGRNSRTTAVPYRPTAMESITILSNRAV